MIQLPSIRRMVVVCLAFCTVGISKAEKHSTKTENVILITTDGLRAEEVFTGADPDLLNKQNGGVADPNALRAQFWRETPEQRREVLMPFLWGVIAKEGQIFGNQKAGSVVQLTNGRKFSYPGYNEMLTGAPDSRINSNALIPNENVTVFEWLNQQKGFKGEIAAFSAWNAMPYIINRERCGFPVMGGWEPVPTKKPNAREQLLNELIAEMTRQNEAEMDDSILFHAAYEHLLKHKPRVMLISFLETDHWAHSGRYDYTLKAAHRVDQYIQKLWETVQSMRQYRGKTTFIITTDHGRGPAPTQWKNHGEKVPNAENIWMAFVGPDTPALGERQNVPRLTQGQVAATIAALLGENYKGFAPNAAQPVEAVVQVK